ncbi:MAG: nuclear transport factor 2 family protein [Polyangia bacterium]
MSTSTPPPPAAAGDRAARNAAVIKAFYDAFARRDGAAMAALYLPDAEFSDPVFPSLRGAEIGAMWKMLCERAADFELTYSGVRGDEQGGDADWQARYTFSRTGRKVHNIIHARFELREGPDGVKIAKHTDAFSFWRWSRQALGPVGLVLGFLPAIQKKVQAQSAKLLADYMKKGAAA